MVFLEDMGYLFLSPLRFIGGLLGIDTGLVLLPFSFSGKWTYVFQPQPQKNTAPASQKNSRRSLCNSFLQHATFCGCISVRSLSARQNDGKQIPTHLLLQVCSLRGNNRVTHYLFFTLLHTVFSVTTISLSFIKIPPKTFFGDHIFANFLPPKI